MNSHTGLDCECTQTILQTIYQSHSKVQYDVSPVHDGGLLAVCETSVDPQNFPQISAVSGYPAEVHEGRRRPSTVACPIYFKFKLASSGLNYANSFYIKPKFDTYGRYDNNKIKNIVKLH
jgi:hypothetical protein